LAIALVALALVFLCLAGAVAWMIHMPGDSFAGALAPLDEAQQRTRDRLRAHVAIIASEEHNLWRPQALAAVEHYIQGQLEQLGFAPRRQGYETPYGRAHNIEITLGPDDGKHVVVIGAHYDSAQGTPGADDNASAVAALIEMARLLKAETDGAWPASAPTLKCVFFVNEEMPFFGSPHMGSLVYAIDAKQRGRRILAMYSLEMLGYYRDEPGSQTYPWPFGLAYPDRGNFLAFVGDLGSRDLVRRSVRAFRSVVQFPSEGVSAPRLVPGLDWSDHWSFRQQGWPAIMITDTSFYRNPHYHSAHDTPDTLDYDRLSRVVHGLSGMLRVMYSKDNSASAVRQATTPPAA
jgi:Zn-dependent M28 family amino/carboxypeptidase